MANDDAEKFTPITFTKTDGRGDHTLVAYSPSDAVRLRFDGWTEKTTKTAPKPGPKPAVG